MNPDSLEGHIRWAVWNYPALYRRESYEASRMGVLDHLFLVIGNGYEWDVRRGILVDGVTHKNMGHDVIPASFFKRQLYELLNVNWHEWNKTARKPKFWYMTEHSGLVFEATSPKRAGQYADRFGIDEHHHAMSASARGDESSPYPLCDYSALVEILDGHTNSPGEQHVKFVPHREWLAGAVEAGEVTRMEADGFVAALEARDRAGTFDANVIAYFVGGTRP